MPKSSSASPRITIATPEQNAPGWGRAGIVAAIGLAVGLLWPKLTGISLAPTVPGVERAAGSATASAQAPASAPSASGEAPVVPASATAAPAGQDANQQLVVVAEATLERCWHGKDMLEAAECGPLRVDPLLVPRLKQLAGCPSALGLSGELQLAFDFDFEKNQLRVVKGKKGDLPSSTVNGVLGCLADYVRDVQVQGIRHSHPKYRVSYLLHFYPPGSRPAAEPVETATAEASEAAAPDARGTAAIAWDSALVRDEPKTGKVVVRLVRGTRVTILSRRQDWYRVRVRNDEGWLYRGALGL